MNEMFPRVELSAHGNLRCRGLYVLAARLRSGIRAEPEASDQRMRRVRPALRKRGEKMNLRGAVWHAHAGPCNDVFACGTGVGVAPYTLSRDAESSERSAEARYSCRKASMGSRREARRAGYQPNSTPTKIE